MQDIIQSSNPIVKSDNGLNTITYLAELSKSDAKWDSHRSNTQSIGNLYSKRKEFKKLAYRMDVCADILEFGRGINKDTGEIKYKLKSAMFCKVRHCPVCSWRRSLKNTARFFSRLPSLQSEFPKHRWLFLTLTVKNCQTDNLKSTLIRMNAAWKRLTERTNWPAAGWVKSTEVTRADDGKAHPHFHVLLMVPASYFSHGYVTQEAWAQRWQDALRVDYEPMVDVRVVKAKHKGQTIEAAIVETLKYSIKVEDAFKDPSWLYDVTTQLHRSRFIATGGALKGILKEEVSNDEMIVTDEDNDLDEESERQSNLFFQWKPSIRRYAKY